MKYILHIVFILFLMSACHDMSHVDRVLDRAKDRLDEYPDSSQRLVESLYPYSRLNESQKARCGVLLAMAKLYQNKSFASDSLLDNSLAYYQQVNDSAALAEAYQLKAYQARWRGQQDSLSFYIQQAVRIVEGRQKELLYPLYIKLANVYSEPSADKDYNKAIRYTRQALTYATTEREKAFALHNLGACYGFMGENDSALFYISRAIDSMPDKGHPDYTTYVLNYVNTQNADFKKAEKYLMELPDTNSLGRLITLGYLYLNHNRIEQAGYYCDKANERYNHDSQRYSINTFNSLRILNACINHSLQKEVLASEGVVKNDSISQTVARNDARNREANENNELLQQHILRLKLKNQRIMTFLLLGIFIVAASFFWYDRHHKVRYIRLRKELDKSRIEQLRKETEISEGEENAPSIDMKNIWKERAEICKVNFIRTGWMESLQLLEGKARSSSLSYLPVAERTKLRNALLEEFTDFIIDLKAAGRGINLDDIILCLLCFLRVNAPVISACMAVSDSAIRTRKSRLKNKLDSEMYQLIFSK